MKKNRLNPKRAYHLSKVLPRVWVCPLLRVSVCVSVPECSGQPVSFVSPQERIGRLSSRLVESESRVQESSLFTGGCHTNLALFLGASHARCLGLGTVGGIRGTLRAAGFFCIVSVK